MKPNAEQPGNRIFLSSAKQKEWKSDSFPAVEADGRRDEGGKARRQVLRESVAQDCCQASSKLHLTSCRMEGQTQR